MSFPRSFSFSEHLDRLAPCRCAKSCQSAGNCLRTIFTAHGNLVDELVVDSPSCESLWLESRDGERLALLSATLGWKVTMTAAHRRLDIEEIGDVTVAKFVDKKILDETNIQIIGNQLFGLTDEDGRKKIILDFTNVEYLSSAALGKLITMEKKVKAAKGQLRLCCIRPEIYEVFEITKLNRIFQIFDTQEQALESF